MQVGEKITVERLPSGLYAISQEGRTTLVGAAASTALALNYTVFNDEANDVPKLLRATA